MQPVTYQDTRKASANSSGEEWIARTLRHTSITEFARILGNALTASDRFPMPILQAALERLRDPQTPVELGQGLVRLLYRACIRGYSCGLVGGESFESLAGKILQALFSREFETGSRLLFQFFVGDSNACRRELCRRYSDEAKRVFDPLLADRLGSVRAALQEEALLDQINHFLRAPLPDSVVPLDFGAGDPINVREQLEHLVLERQEAADDEDEKSGQVTRLSLSEAAEPVLVSFIGWARLRSVIQTLLALKPDGPFGRLITVAPWREVAISTRENRIAMEFTFSAIGSNQHHGLMLPDVCAAVAHLLSEASVPVEESGIRSETWKDGCRVTAVACLPLARLLPESLRPLGKFFAVIDEENRRYYQDYLPASDFYRSAYQRFRDVHLEPEGHSLEEWIDALRSRLDREHAVIADCFLLADQAKSPLRAAVHDLKTQTRFARNACAAGVELTDEQIAEMQVQIHRLLDDIHKIIGKSIHGDEAHSTDLTSLVEREVRLIEQLMPIRCRLALAPVAYARVDPLVMRKVLLNLLQNAAEAIVRVKHSAEIEVSLLAEPETGASSLSIKNPYDPRPLPNAASTRLGLANVRYLIETLSGGRLHVLPDSRRGIWTVRMTFGQFSSEEIRNDEEPVVEDSNPDR